MTTSISSSRDVYPPEDIENIQLPTLNSRTNPDQAHPTAPHNEAPLITYPEGGLAAWLVVLGAFSGLCGGVGTMNTMGAFQAYISQHQLRTSSDAAIGWIFGVYAFLSYFCGLLVGPLFDAYPAHYLILAGGVGVAVSMFLAGVCATYWQFMLVFGVLNGVSTSLLFVPCFTVIGHWFHRRRGFATGLAALGGAVGGIAYPSILQVLIPPHGWAVATRTLGFILLLLCILSSTLIRKRLPPTRGQTRPQLSLRILSQPIFATMVGAAFLLEMALFIPLTYLASYATRAGFSDAFGSQLLVALNASSILGRLIPGFFSDKIGRFNTLLLITGLMAVSVFGIWLPSGATRAGLLVFAIVFGFASGSAINLVPVCVGQLCETEEYGRYYATCTTVVSFGLLLGIPVAGWIVKSAGGAYWGLVVFVGCCYVGGLVPLAVARAMAVGVKINVVF